MVGLRTTAAVVALVGAGAFGSAMLLAQDEGGVALRDAIAAQQQQTLELAGAAEPAPIEVSADLLSEEELDDLVAPVALYPDALLAQVLVAAAFPLQVAKADQLIDVSADMTEDELSDELASREFDPSVLVLMSGFPTVISRMAEDLDWTDRLGQAMVAQDDDVLAAVQRMRAEAESQGNLTSNAAQVIEKDDDQIYIKPADPEVVYVPTYDPETVYTTAYAPATTSTPYVAPQTGTNPLANPFVAGALAFGGGLLVSELFDDDDNNNKNKNKNNGGWNGYWQNGRPIDWHDRQFYPRPIYAGAAPTSWSRERDRDWDRRTARWHRSDAEAIRAYQAGRQDTLKEIQRNTGQRAERMRQAAREERARAEAQRDRITEQRRKAEKAADAQRKEEAAAVKARREKAAEQEKDRAKREARREKQAQEERAAAAKARKENAAKREDANQKAAKARDEARAKRKAAEDEQAKEAARKADDKRKAARKAAEEDQAKAAAAQRANEQKAAEKRKANRKAAEEDQAKAAASQRANEQKAAEKRKAARQAARNCKQNPEDKDCKASN